MTPDERNEAIRAVVASIPPGMVMTYGDVAVLVPGASARSVGRAMKEDSQDLPWWRVVNVSGRPPPGSEDAAHSHFVDEHTPLVERIGRPYVVATRLARWVPDV